MSTCIQSSSNITPDAVEAFRKHGFVHIPFAFSGQNLERLLRCTDEIIAAPETPGKWMKYFEKGEGNIRLLNRVENFFDYWPELLDAFEDPSIRQLLKALFGGKYFLFKEKLNVKLDGGGGFAPHQDGMAWKVLTQESITLMVAVDAADEANGALQVDSQFSSGRRYLPHQKGRLVEYADIAWETIPMQPGDIIAFSSFLPHMSIRNTSGRSRRAYFVTYNSYADGDRRREYLAFKRKTFPPEVERKEGTDYSDWRARLSRDLL